MFSLILLAEKLDINESYHQYDDKKYPKCWVGQYIAIDPA